MMVNPFDAWTRLWTVSLGMADTGRKVAETAAASRQVIAVRTDMIEAAARAPLQGDYAELGRMVPEKVEAFTKSGQAMATHWWAMQSALLAGAQVMQTAALRGRPPTAAELAALGKRGMGDALALVEQGAGMAAKGIAPIHARATANARRLKGPRR